jgi:NAD+ synthase
MDLALWAFNHGLAPEELAAALEVTREQAELVYADIRSKRRATRYLHAKAVLVEPVSEVGNQ